MDRSHARRAESRIDGDEPRETLREQSGGDEQDERQRHLAGHERVRRAAAAATTDRASAAFLQHGKHARPHGTPRRHEAERHARDGRHRGGKRDHDPVHANLIGPWHGCGHDPSERAHRPPGERDAGAAAGEREQRAFDERASSEREGTGAERGADGEVLRRARRSRDQQARHVRAGDEQDEHDRAEQHPQRGADVADDLFVRRDERDAPSRVGVGMLARDAVSHGVHVGLRLADRHAWPESSDRLIHPVRPGR